MLCIKYSSSNLLGYYNIEIRKMNDNEVIRDGIGNTLL